MMPTNQTKKFKIGNFVFQVTYPDDICPPKNFLLFETRNEDAVVDYSYCIERKTSIEFQEILESLKQTPVAVRDDLMVYRDSSLEMRLIRARGREDYYALYDEQTEAQAIIYLNEAMLNLLVLDTVFSSLFSLERRLLSKSGLVLHCAYLQYGQNAILFSAPSGVGKSTQASLWEKYKNGAVVNGDRALLLCQKDKWHAYGWPVCGSSEICHNTSLQIRAIVMLSQGKKNELSPLSSMQAFKELYSQITINSWDKKAALDSMELLEHLIKKIPVYHLSCTISKEAVDLLADELYPSMA